MSAILPEGWPRPSGYANAIDASPGRTIFLAGQIGWDPTTQAIVSDDFVAQTRQAMANIIALLGAAGARPEHLVRMTWFVTDRDAYIASRRALGAVWRDAFGAHYPAMSVVFVASLLEERAKVEIEATAVAPIGGA